MFDRIVVVLLLFQFLFKGSFAQSTTFEKTLKQAEKKVASKKYSEAITILEEIIAVDSTQPKVWFQLGEVHLIIRDYIAAKTHFQKAYLLAKNTLPVAGYRYAQLLKLNGDYENAKKVFEEFIAN
jgi:tetratricopeptide (TPR) repeat protein